MRTNTSACARVWIPLGGPFFAALVQLGCSSEAGEGSSSTGTGGSNAIAEPEAGGASSAETGAAAGPSAAPLTPTFDGAGGRPEVGLGGAAIAPTDPGDTGGSTAPAPVDPSAELYDPSNLPRFDLELPQASIDALQQVTDAADPRGDEYVTASLTYGAETITNIGLRLKGEGSFQELDRKPALKLKFDAFVAGQSFAGLRRMTLNNGFEDPSLLAERLAYEVFRAADLPAPRCNNATLYINGTYYGVYVNVEAIDKTFLRRWFASDEGNLYEEGQRDFVAGAEQAFDLETNELENDRSDLQGLIAAVGAATESSFLDAIGTHLDTTQFLRFTAAEAAVNQWDMYAYTVFYVNNLRLYFDPTAGKFSFIPWGMDLSMKPFRDSGKAFIGAFELARGGDRPNAPVTSGLLFQRCLESAECRRAYADALGEIARVYSALDLEHRAAEYHAQIEAAVLADTRKNICCAPDPTLTNEAFRAAHQSVLETIRGRTDALRADIASMR